MQLRPGDVFAEDFLVERELGRGGMGAVYVVEQRSTGKRRALKLMSSELLTDARAAERFLQEAKVGARVASEHVVEVIAAGVDRAGARPVPWLAMELLEGESLADAVERDGAMSPTRAREILRQLCHGLGAAHRAGLVHRDVKPDNVFLAQTQSAAASLRVKLLDFGIAKILAPTVEGVGRTTAPMGTPLFMAPEQTRAGAVDPRADVWALGLLAYHLLTGQHYWRAAQELGVPLTALLVEISVDPIEPPSARAAAHGVSLPAGFDAWFLRCVNRDLDARFPDATAAWDALAGRLSEDAFAATLDSGQLDRAQLANRQLDRAQLASGQLASGQLASGQLASGQLDRAQLAQGQRSLAALGAPSPPATPTHPSAPTSPVPAPDAAAPSAPVPAAAPAPAPARASAPAPAPASAHTTAAAPPASGGRIALIAGVVMLAIGGAALGYGLRTPEGPTEASVATTPPPPAPDPMAPLAPRPSADAPAADLASPGADNRDDRTLDEAHAHDANRHETSAADTSAADTSAADTSAADTSADDTSADDASANATSTGDAAADDATTDPTDPVRRAVAPPPRLSPAERAVRDNFVRAARRDCRTRLAASGQRRQRIAVRVQLGANQSTPTRIQVRPREWGACFLNSAGTLSWPRGPARTIELSFVLEQ